MNPSAKPKSNSPSPKSSRKGQTPDAPSENPTASSIEMAKRIDEITSTFPPLAEHFKAAAILSTGRPINRTVLANAARQALDLWGECQDAQRFSAFVKALSEQTIPLAAKIKEANKVPTPKSFPVSIEEYQRLALPKERTEDRAKLWKEMVRDLLRGIISKNSNQPPDQVPNPTDQDCANWVTEHFRGGMEEDVFADFVQILREFAVGYKAVNSKIHVSAAGLKSGVSRLISKFPYIKEVKLKNELLKQFISIERLHGASLEQLTKILGEPIAVKLKADLVSTCKD